MKTPFHSAVTLLIFLLTIIGTYALAPSGLKLRIPRTGWRVPLYYCWVPWLSIAILLLLQAITPKDIGAALAGDSHLRPATVIVTHLSLSYLAVSCEITGLFGWLALHIARRTREKSPLLLLCALVGLSALLSAATSADVSLVALTPVMVYAAAAAGWDTMSLAATHMGAASVSGMLVAVSGTPNILAAQAFGLSFMRFLAWMVLPTATAAVVTLGLLYLLLHRRRRMSARYDTASGSMPYPDPGILLHDQVGAAFSSATLTVCLLALAVGPSLRWSTWAVATVFATAAALYNLMALLGPLRATIGRRGAYERRKRLHAELAQQGLRRVVSDEDLADLLLSAAQHRQASFTRLAAAAASRAGGPAGSQHSYPGLPYPHPSSRTTRPQQSQQLLLQQQGQQGQQGNSGSGPSRHSGSGWGLGLRLSSSGLGLGGGGGGGFGSGSPSMGSLPSMGGGGGGGGSPVRHWFSQRWSSLRGWAAPAGGVSADLLEAAADAGANLSILGEYGTAGGSRAAVGNATGTAPHWQSSAAAASASAAAAPGMSTELQQLLTHGTAAAPDAPEWWAAAAHSAQEVLQLRVGSTPGPAFGEPAAAVGCDAGVSRHGETSPRPWAASSGRWGCWWGLGIKAAGAAGGPCSGQAASTGADGAANVGEAAPAPAPGVLTKESAFAVADAMRVPGWDGGPVSASAWRQPAESRSKAAEAPPADAGGGSGPQPMAAAPPPRQMPLPGAAGATGAAVLAVGCGRDSGSIEDSTRIAVGQQAKGQRPLSPPPSPHPHAQPRHPHGQHPHRAHPQHNGLPGLPHQLSHDPGSSSTTATSGGGGGGGGKHPRTAHGGVCTAASASAADLRDTLCPLDSDPGGHHSPSGTRWKRTASAGGLAAPSCGGGGGCSRGAGLHGGNGMGTLIAAADASREGGAGGADGGSFYARGDNALLSSYHDPTRLPDQLRQHTNQQPAVGAAVAGSDSRSPQAGSQHHSKQSFVMGKGAAGYDRCGPGASTYRQQQLQLQQQQQQQQQLGGTDPLLHPPEPGRWSLDRCSSPPLEAELSPTEPLLPAPPSDPDPDPGQDGGSDLSLQRRQTLPSTSGFEGLFGCWRPSSGEEAESAALLPSRRPGAAAASDDPCHGLLSVPPLPPLPPPPTVQLAQLQQPVSPQLLSPRATVASANASSHAVETAAGCVACGGAGGQAAAGTTTTTTTTTTTGTPAAGVATAPRCIRSPFARSANVAFDASVTGGAGGGGGVYGGVDGGGGAAAAAGGGLSRCNSLSSVATSCGQQRLRPPSLGFLLFGPSEVTFLGTFLSLPWANAVLLLGMFVMVEALQVHGWVDSLTHLLNAMLGVPSPTPSSSPLPASATSTTSSASSSSSFTHTAFMPPDSAPSSFVPSPASAVFAVGWLAAGLAVAMTGQSATLLLARAMLHPDFLPSFPFPPETAAGENNSLPQEGPQAPAGSGGGPSAAARHAAHLALVVAANLAPALALSGSLAALRWGLGLRQLGVRLRCCRYLVSGLLPAVLAGMAAGLMVLWGQCVAWGS